MGTWCLFGPTVESMNYELDVSFKYQAQTIKTKHVPCPTARIYKIYHISNYGRRWEYEFGMCAMHTVHMFHKYDAITNISHRESHIRKKKRWNQN